MTTQPAESVDKAKQLESLLQKSLQRMPPAKDENTSPTGIVGDCWIAIGLNPMAFDSRLSEFFPTLDPEVTVYVAGNDSEPDSNALTLAVEVVNELYALTAQIKNLEPSTWNISAVSFPYQNCGVLWYMELQSEYGGDIEFCFSRSTNNPSAYRVEQITYNTISFPQVPAVVQWALEELKRANITDSEFDGLLAKIEREHLCGPEVLGSVTQLYKKLSAVLPTYTYNRMLDVLAKCPAHPADSNGA